MRALLGLTALLGLLALAPLRAATAGSGCGCGPGFHRPHGPDRCSVAARFHANRPCSSPRWPRYGRVGYGVEHGCYARGSSWVGLRRYYDPIRYLPRHRHPRLYFFDRWPCALGEDAPAFLDRECPGEDFPHVECPIAQFALGGEEEVPRRDVEDLALEDRLALGMERFHRGAFDEAATDFRAVCREAPNDPRARTGLLLTALMRGDTEEAVRSLRRLHDLGEVNGGDRLVLEACMERPERFLDVRDARTAATRWNFHRVEPLVVAAWANVVTGETESARGLLRSALRFAPGHPVARPLLASLDARPAPRSTPPAAVDAASGVLARETAD